MIRLAQFARRGLGVFFLIDGASKVVQPPPLGDFIDHLGFTPGVVTLIGVLLIVSTTLYLIPRTAVFGAVMMTGYFGGALAAHARVGDPAITYLAVGTFGILIWSALYVIDPRVRRALSLRQ